MKLVILFGPQAVGKMTVGQELAKQTGLKLFHNHMTIDLVSNFFDYGTVEGKRLVSLFRQEIFEAVAESGLPGLIFTYVWAFDMQEDWAYIESLYQLFRTHGAEVCTSLSFRQNMLCALSAIKHRTGLPTSQQNATWCVQRQSFAQWKRNIGLTLWMVRSLTRIISVSIIRRLRRKPRLQ